MSTEKIVDPPIRLRTCGSGDMGLGGKRDGVWAFGVSIWWFIVHMTIYLPHPLIPLSPYPPYPSGDKWVQG